MPFPFIFKKIVISAILLGLPPLDGFLPIPSFSLHSLTILSPTASTKITHQIVAPSVTTRLTTPPTSPADRSTTGLQAGFQQSNIQDTVRAWRSKYCSLPQYRRVHGRNKKRDAGDWGPVTVRAFYNFKIKRAINELREIGLPDKEVGDYAYEARNTIKVYARERSWFVLRALVYCFEGLRELFKTGKFDPKYKSLEQLKLEIRSKILDEAENIDEITEDMIDTWISLELLAKAGRTNQHVNSLAFSDPGADLPRILDEAWSKTLDALQDAFMIAYEDTVAVFLLDKEDGMDLVPVECKEFLRGLYPGCYRDLQAIMHRRRRRSLQNGLSAETRM